MNYQPDYTKKLEKKLFKLKRKGPNQMQAIEKKIPEILENPYRFKPLSGKFTGIYRVHIMKSFVLTFEIHENEKIIKFLDYDHHDNIYE